MTKFLKKEDLRFSRVSTHANLDTFSYSRKSTFHLAGNTIITGLDVLVTQVKISENHYIRHIKKWWDQRILELYNKTPNIISQSGTILYSYQ